MSLRIKNWKQFQHFKDRRPPWIKLYRNLLDDREWAQLSPGASKTLIMLWLLASETQDGSLPEVHIIAFRLRMNKKTVESHVSELKNWLIQDDINMISLEHQLGPSETETETETETERRAREFEIVWGVFPKKVGRLAARKAWMRLNGSTPTVERIVEAIEQQRQSTQWQDLKFVPHLSTWLNGERWTDAVVAPAVVTSRCAYEGCQEIAVLGKRLCQRHVDFYHTVRKRKTEAPDASG